MGSHRNFLQYPAHTLPGLKQQPASLHIALATQADRVIWLRLAGYVLFYTVAANIPFWTATHLLDLLPLGWFCIEFAAIGLLSLFIPRFLASLLLLLTLAADILSAICKTYYLAPTDCFANLSSIADFPTSRLIAVVIITGLAILTAAFPYFLPVRSLPRKSRLQVALCLLAFSVTATAVDCITVFRENHQLSISLGGRRPSDINHFSDWSYLWAGRYPLVRIRRNQLNFGKISLTSLHRKHSLKDAPSIAGATPIALAASHLLSPTTARNRTNLVLVLVESWGIEQDTPIRNALTAPYAQPDLLPHYRVLQGVVPFIGGTIEGETRELCSSTLGTEIALVPRSGLDQCLPSRLSALGYRAMAFHGMDGTLFRRESWWKTIGFQEIWFHNRLRQLSLSDCYGAFVGICDTNIAENITGRMQSSDDSPGFFYWVTLNSHLPVPVPSWLTHAASCSVAPILTTHTALCSWFQIVDNLHESVAEMALSKMARPTIFVIVGDHAPPFSSNDLASQFDHSRVPYVILIPR